VDGREARSNLDVVVMMTMVMMMMPTVRRSGGRDGEGQAEYGDDGDQGFAHVSVSSLARGPAGDAGL